MMLSTIWKLLRARWRITWNNIWRSRRRRKIGLAFAAFGLAIFAAFLTLVSWRILALLQRPGLAAYVTPNLVRSMPVFFTSATFLAGLLTNFGVLLQSLYLAGDMEFLLAAPVPPRAVFVTKLVQAVLPNFLFMCLFNFPALIGLGMAQQYNALYYVMLPVTLALLMLAGAGISAIAVMLVVRLIPARRVAEVLGLVGGITSLLCSQSSQLVRVSGLGRGASSAQMAALANTAAQFDTPYSPLAWPGRMLVALGEGQWQGAPVLVGATAAMTLGAFMASLVAAERLYISGWARTQSGVAPRKIAHAERRHAAGARRLLPAAFTALVAKDFKLLTRDLRNLSQLITPMVLGVVYTVSLVSGARRGPVTLFENQMLAYGGLGTALFVAWIFAGRLALGGIGMEGKRYWILRVAPLRAEALLGAKFTVAYLPAVVLGTLFLLATAIAGRQSFATLPYNWAALAATIAALCAVYLAFGTIGANLRWEDPRQIISGTMGCLGWMAGTATIAIVSGVFAGIPLLFSWFSAPAALAQLVGLVVGLSLCAGILTVSFLWARARIARVGEG